MHERGCRVQVVAPLVHRVDLCHCPNYHAGAMQHWHVKKAPDSTAVHVTCTEVEHPGGTFKAHSGTHHHSARWPADHKLMQGGTKMVQVSAKN